MNGTEDNDYDNETTGFLNDPSSVSGGGGAPHVVLQRQERQSISFTFMNS